MTAATVELIRDADALTVRVTGPLTIYSVREIRDALLPAIAEARSLDFDLTEVEEMDTCGYQLLLAILKKADDRGIAFRVNGHSPAAHSVFDIYNALETLRVVIT